MTNKTFVCSMCGSEIKQGGMYFWSECTCAPNIHTGEIPTGITKEEFDRRKNEK